FNARELMRRLAIEPPRTADPNVLANVGLTAKLLYDGKGLQLEELKGQVDETHITGKAQVPSFDPLAARFQLALDQINLDRYLAPAEEGKPVPEKAPEKGPAEAGELPLETLRKLDLDGTVAIGQMTVKKLHASDVKTRITAHNGVIKAEPVAQLYQGRLRGLLTLDATSNDPKISMQQQLDGVQAGSLLEDLVGVARILGVADLNLAVGMHGASMDDWLRTMSGKGSFKFADGAINGINIAQAIQTARAKLANEPEPAEAQQAQTPFNVLQGSLQINEGLVLNRDFNLASSQFKVAGDGQFNLRTQVVDYTLNVNLLEPLLKSDNKLLAELQNVPIPVHISGNYRDLGVSVDLQQAVERAGKEQLQAVEEKAKTRVQEEVQQRQQEVEQKLQEQVQDKLQDLLRPKPK
ncbi:MAG TPA: AsmA-like C-terminal region-containing protein, partial [Gammaproteobacteria bacterium]|nr:AsmA-like C-terminal region-containing protein [Gammaproteobacteria bacterium]